MLPPGFYTTLDGCASKISGRLKFFTLKAPTDVGALVYSEQNARYIKHGDIASRMLIYRAHARYRGCFMAL